MRKGNIISLRSDILIFLVRFLLAPHSEVVTLVNLMGPAQGFTVIKI